jgi:hypothetical protein
MEFLQTFMIIIVGTVIFAVFSVIMIAGFRDGIWPSLYKQPIVKKNNSLLEYYFNDELDTFTEYIHQGNNEITREFFKHDGNYGYIIRSSSQDKVGVWVYCGVTNTTWQYYEPINFTAGLFFKSVLDNNAETFWENEGLHRITLEEYQLSIKTVTKDNSRKKN